MANSESIKEIMSQVTVQAATTVMMPLRDTEMGSQPPTMQIQQETQRQMKGGLTLEKPRFNWATQDRYVKLLNFQIKVMNILKTRAYMIND